MPGDWRYCAETAGGGVVSGLVEAASEEDALAALRARQLRPLSLEAARPSAFSRFASGSAQTLSLADLAAATRRMSDLTNAGLPLVKALELARDQASSPKQRSLFADLAAQVRAGEALSTALQKASVKTPVFLHALVRTGESIGALPKQLSILADHYERALKTRREIVAQLVYPAALMTLIILTMIFLSYFVLPQFETIFENAGAAPPIETRITLAAAAFIRSNLAFAPSALLLAFLALHAARRRYGPEMEQALLAAPFIGRLRRDHEIGRYCRSLAAMLKGGMALSDAMPLAADSVGLARIREELAMVETAVRSGRSLSASLAAHAAPAKEVVSFLEVGDETGTLGDMAEQAARFSETRIDATLKRFMALLSPALTAIMGLVTAGVIAAVMSGVLSLNDAVY